MWFPAWVTTAAETGQVQDAASLIWLEMRASHSAYGSGCGQFRIRLSAWKPENLLAVSVCSLDGWFGSCACVRPGAGAVSFCMGARSRRGRHITDEHRDNSVFHVRWQFVFRPGCVIHPPNMFGLIKKSSQ